MLTLRRRSAARRCCEHLLALVENNLLKHSSRPPCLCTLNLRFFFPNGSHLSPVQGVAPPASGPPARDSYQGTYNIPVSVVVNRKLEPWLQRYETVSDNDCLLFVG